MTPASVGPGEPVRRHVRERTRAAAPFKRHSQGAFVEPALTGASVTAKRRRSWRAVRA